MTEKRKNKSDKFGYQPKNTTELVQKVQSEKTSQDSLSTNSNTNTQGDLGTSQNTTQTIPSKPTKGYQPVDTNVGKPPQGGSGVPLKSNKEE